MADRIKLLLIEDTLSLLDVYKTRFVTEGFDVLTATNGTTAIDLANKINPDLFIVDIMLPDMDGLQFIDTIKKLPAHKDAGFIVLTALEMEEVKQKALALGVDAFLVKSQTSLEEIASTALSVLKSKKPAQ